MPPPPGEAKHIVPLLVVGNELFEKKNRYWLRNIISNYSAEEFQFF
jgi:hypothetical protein